MVLEIKNRIKKHIAINEVSILRQSRQFLYLFIMALNRSKKLVSDGVGFTPAGGTAYNLSVHGPILFKFKKIIYISTSPFRPRR